MVAIFAGSGTGLENGSGSVLGGAGLHGQSSLGRAGESLFFNAANGNLVISQQDEFLTGRGPDVGISRTYNSQGTWDGDNNDNWQFAGKRRWHSYVAGVSVTRTGADGSDILYSYVGANIYRAKDGGGAHDELKRLNNGAWVRTDGDSQTKETYDNTGNLILVEDNDGNAVTYSYDLYSGGWRLIGVNTSDGSQITYSYSGYNVTKITTGYTDLTSGTAKTLTRTYYGYDSSNRLIKVTTDLSPQNNSIADGKTYVTNYTYHGNSKQIASVSQTDGSRLEIEYDAQGRVTEFKQTVVAGEARTTRIGYGHNITSVTDATDQVTRFTYDDEGQLLQLMTPPAYKGGPAQVTQFEYDVDGNVIRTIETDSDNASVTNNLVKTNGWGDGEVAGRGENLVDDSGWPQNTDGTLPVNGTIGQGWTGYYTDQETEWTATSGPYGEQIISLHTGQADTAADGGGAISNNFDIDKSKTYEYTLYFKADELNKHRIYFGLGYGVVKNGDNGISNNNPYFTYDYPNAASGVEAGKWYKVVGYVLPEDAAAEPFGSHGGVYDIETGEKVRNIRHFIWDNAQSGTSSYTRFFNYYNTDNQGKYTHFYKPEVREVSSIAILRDSTKLDVERDANLLQAPQPENWSNYSWTSNDDEARWNEVVGPDGARQVALQTGEFDGTTTSGRDGGGGYTNQFEVDPTKAYKFTQYVRKSDLSRHYLYFGLSAASASNPYVKYGHTGTDATNPYFLSWGDDTQRANLEEDKWYKLIGYVLPVGSADQTHGTLGGFYDAETGSKVAGLYSYRWHENMANTSVHARFFNYYDQTEHGWSTDWMAPEVVELEDGELAADNANPFGIVYDDSGAQTHYEHDANGNIIKVIDPNGNVTKRTYDSNNNLLTKTVAGTSASVALSDNLTPKLDSSWHHWNLQSSTVDPIDGQDAVEYTIAPGLANGAVLKSVGAVTAGDTVSFQITVQAKGDVTSHMLGLYGSISGWGNPNDGESVGHILNGPGELVQSASGYWYVTGLSQTAITTIKLQRTYSADQAAYPHFYVDYPTGQAGDSVILSNPVTMISKKDTTTVSSQFTTRYVYDGENHLRYAISAEGNVTEYYYATNGQMYWQVDYPQAKYDVDALSADTALTETQLNAWRSALDNSQSKITYRVYDARGNLTRTSGFSGAKINWGYVDATDGYSASYYTYDQSGQLLSRYNQGELAETFVYDGMNRLVASTDLNGGTTNILFNDAASNTVMTLANGQTTTSTYNKAGELISETRGSDWSASATSNYVYDRNGRLRMATDGTNNVNYLLYDKQGRKIADISQYGNLIEYQYDRRGFLTSTVRYYSGIASDKVSSLANPDNSFEIADIRPTYINGGDIWTWTIYDDSGRVIQDINGDGRVSEYQYDQSNRLVRTIDRYTVLTAAQIAQLRATPPENKLKVAAHAQDSISRTFYDRDGRVIGTLNAEGYLTRNFYDKAGQLVRTTAYLGATSVALRTNGTLTELYNSIVQNSAKDLISRNIYDGQGQLRYTIDANRNVISYSYNAAGRQTGTIVHHAPIAATSDYSFSTIKAKVAAIANSSNDRTTSIAYNSHGQVTSTTDAGGLATFFAYDNIGQVTKTVVGTGSTARTVRNYYTQRGELRFTVDAEGYVTEQNFDAEGRVLNQIRYETAQSFNDGTSIGSVSAAVGSDYANGRYQQHSYNYDDQGRIANEYDGLNTRTYYWYRANGEMGWKSIAAGSADEAVLEYNSFNQAGQLTWTGAAWGQAEQTEANYWYDGLGRLYQTRDPNGKITSYTHDKLGRVLTETNAEGGVTSYEYNAFGQVVKVTDPRGNASYNYYDNQGRLTKSRDAESYVTETSYTVFGEIASVKRSYNRTTSGVSTVTPPTVVGHSKDATTSFEYDKRGLVTKSTDAQGHFETYTYDAYGNRITSSAKSSTVSTSAGGTTTYAYDKRGLLISETLPIKSYASSGSVQTNTVVNSFSYDARGNRVQMVEASNVSGLARTTSYVYDKADRLIETIGQTFLGQTPHEYIAYDARGNVTRTTDAVGAKTFFFYDDLNRKTVEINALGTYSKFTYDKNGNVIEARVYANTVALPADGGSEEEAPGVPSGASRVTTFTYDNINRMTKSAVAAGVQTGHWNGSAWVAVATAIETQYQYDANGNVVKMTDPNGNTTFSYYDKSGRKTAQVDGEGYRTDWSYDSEGNVLRERRYVNKAANPTSTLNPPAVSANASLDRITDFTYDKVGNRIVEIRRSVLKHNGNGGTNTADAIIGYVYNGLGQVTRKSEASGDFVDYVYDAGGRLYLEARKPYTDHTGTNVTPTVDYYYDGLGNLSRTRQRGSGDSSERVTTYAYNAGKLRAMTDGSGFTRYYWHDIGGRVTADYYTRTGSDGSSINYYDGTLFHYDILGRVTEERKATYDLSNGWSDETPSTKTNYNVFGEVTSVSMGTYGAHGTAQQHNKYDDAGRLWATNSGDGVWKYFGYDKNGNQTIAITSAGYDLTNKTFSQAFAQISRSDVNATYTTYDKRNLAKTVVEEGRQLAQTGALQKLTTSRSYNGFGEVTAETNANGATINYTYNNMGRLIKSESPLVSITAENGAVSNVRPTENYYYDASGRLVASRDANGNLTKLSLLAGTGYGGSQALITQEIHADGGIKKTGFDIHGDARKLTDEINRTTTQVFDKMGRVKQINHAGGLIDYITYDGLGQQLTHYNNLLGTGNKEITDYDIQGRVISSRAFGGDMTTTSYTWNGGIDNTGAGLTNVGGWTQVTTYANSRTLTEQTDLFGRTISKNDLGSHVTNFTYDKAGRLASSAIGGMTTSYTYLNTGQVGKITTGAGTVSSTTHWTLDTATYSYDKVGNRLTEQFRKQSGDYTAAQMIWWNPYEPDFIPATYVTTNILVKNATATYDALGRLQTWVEAGSTTSPASSLNQYYDANGNIRRTTATFRSLDAQGAAATTATTKDYWFRFDNMNRLVTDKGQLSGAAGAAGTTITRGSATYLGAGGQDILYDKAGQRIAVLARQAHSGPYGISSYSESRESYTYNAAGQLIQTRVSQGATVTGYVSTTPPSAPTGGTLRSTFAYDLMGRQISQIDREANGYTVAYSRSANYDAKGQLQSETTNTKRGNDIFKSIISYGYGYGASDALGNALTVSAFNYKNNNSSQAPNTLTTNSYQYWDGAVQSSIVHKPNISQSTQFITSFYYDSRGVLTKAHVGDYYAQTVTFTNDENGQIIRRDESNVSTSNGAPHEVWYRFGGRQLGYTGNNGTSDVSTSKSIQERQATPPTTHGVFRGGQTSGLSYADFAQSYDPLNSYNQGAGSGSYTARAGDTLQGVAQQIYGDASLWYKIAQANGLSGSSRLAEGQRLQLPTGIAKNTHNANSFKPYNPGENIGDLTPSTTQPPKNSSKCGVFGQILIAVIAVAVSIALPGGGTVIGAAINGAIGSVVSQAVGVATGIQEKFSFKGVALAAIGAGVGSALKGLQVFSKLGKVTKFANDVARGALGSAISQGIGVATGLQDKFSWAGVAAAGIAAGVGGAVGRSIDGKSFLGQSINEGDFGHALATSAASGIANAATRSAINGESFGNNLLAALPDIIGQAIGGAIGNGIKSKIERAQADAEQSPVSRSPVRQIAENTFVAELSNGETFTGTAQEVRAFAFEQLRLGNASQRLVAAADQQARQSGAGATASTSSANSPSTSDTGELTIGGEYGNVTIYASENGQGSLAASVLYYADQEGFDAYGALADWTERFQSRFGLSASEANSSIANRLSQEFVSAGAENLGQLFSIYTAIGGFMVPEHSARLFSLSGNLSAGLQPITVSAARGYGSASGLGSGRGEADKATAASAASLFDSGVNWVHANVEEVSLGAGISGYFLGGLGYGYKVNYNLHTGKVSGTFNFEAGIGFGGNLGIGPSVSRRADPLGTAASLHSSLEVGVGPFDAIGGYEYAQHLNGERLDPRGLFGDLEIAGFDPLESEIERRSREQSPNGSNGRLLGAKVQANVFVVDIQNKHNLFEAPALFGN